MKMIQKLKYLLLLALPLMWPASLWGQTEETNDNIIEL